MKKLMILCFAAAALTLSVGCGSALAQNHGAQGQGGGGGAYSNSNGNGNGMHHGGYQARHGFHRFRDFHGRRRIIIGGPFFWPPVYRDPFFYPDAAALMYVQPQANYNYYCNDPPGYYPDVPACPSGWLRLAPDDAPY